MNLSRWILDAQLAAGRGEAIAAREPRGAWTWTRLDREVERCAAGYLGLGLAPGDRVALLLQDSLDFVAGLLGAIRIGAVPVPLSMIARSHDVRRIVGDARPKLALVHADLIHLFDEARDELPDPPEIVVLPRPDSADGEPSGPADFFASPGTAVAPWDGDQPALLLYSSGGALRGVPHGGEAVLAAHRAWAERILGLDDRDRVYSTAGFYSVFGLTAGLLFPLLAGATACLLPGRARPQAVFDALAAFRPTVFASTPSLWVQMLQDWRELAPPPANPLAGVRAAVTGAEPLPEPLWRRVFQGFGVELIHGFGSTESLGVFLSSRPGDHRPGSSGRLVDGYEARILDPAGRPVGTEEIGALSVRGASIAGGYRVGADPTVFGADGWLHTGDRFFVDRQGWYFHCGRIDDRFRVSGKYVSPGEVEETLLGHPAVWECAVVGREDGDGLLIPVAYVVPNVGHPPSQELGRELIDFVKRSIAPYKYPRRIEFVGELPKSARGETQRWRLGRT